MMFSSCRGVSDGEEPDCEEPELERVDEDDIVKFWIAWSVLRAVCRRWHIGLWQVL